MGTDDADEAARLRELLRWALQVIDDDLGYEVAQQKGPSYREAKAAVTYRPEDDEL